MTGATARQEQEKTILSQAWKTAAAVPEDMTEERAATAFATYVYGLPLTDKVSLLAAAVDKVLDATGNMPDLATASDSERARIYSAWCAALITANNVTVRLGAPDSMGETREKDVMRQTEKGLSLMADFAAANEMPQAAAWQQRLSWYKKIDRNLLAEIVAPFSPNRDIRLPPKPAAK